MRLVRGAALLALTACGDPMIVVRRAWPAEQQVVLAVHDPSDRPLEPAPRVFPPGEKIFFPVSTESAFRLYFRTFDPSNGGPDLVACGVRYGARAPLPVADTAWVSPLIEPGESGEIAIAEERPPRELGLELASCPPTEDPCARIAVTRVPADAFTDADLTDVVAIDDDVAYFAGQSGFGKVEDNVATRAFGALDPPPRRLAWDGAARLYGVSHQTLYAVVLATGDVTTYTLTATASGIAATTDTLAVYGSYGVRELVAGATVASALSALDVDLDDLVIVRRDRAVALGKLEMYFLDGVRWRSEYTFRASAFEEWNQIAGDATAFVAVDRYSQVLVRNEEQRSWRLKPTPFEMRGEIGPRWRDVSVLGGGDFIIAGDGGTLLARIGDRWCEPESPLANLPLAISASPSGRVAYVVGADNDVIGDGPVILRIDLAR